MTAELSAELLEERRKVARLEHNLVQERGELSRVRGWFEAARDGKAKVAARALELEAEVAALRADAATRAAELRRSKHDVAEARVALLEAMRADLAGDRERLRLILHDRNARARAGELVRKACAELLEFRLAAYAAGVPLRDGLDTAAALQDAVAPPVAPAPFSVAAAAVRETIAEVRRSEVAAGRLPPDRLAMHPEDLAELRAAAGPELRALPDAYLERSPESVRFLGIELYSSAAVPRGYVVAEPPAGSDGGA